MTKDKISVDGNIYILFSKHQKLVADEKRKDCSKFEFCEAVLDPANIFGIGSAELKGKWVSSRISLDLIKRAIGILDKLGQNNVDVVFTNDYPVIFGKLNKPKGIVAGVIMAPKVGDD